MGRYGEEQDVRCGDGFSQIGGNANGPRNANARKELHVFSSALKESDVLRKRPPQPYAVSTLMEMDGERRSPSAISEYGDCDRVAA